jgi:hypothetical protein
VAPAKRTRPPIDDEWLARLTLRVLAPSRKRIRAGDVFAMLPKDGKGYLFGRVITTTAVAHGWDRMILIYVYRFRSKAKEAPPQEELSPDSLLVPPIMTDRLAWSKGFSETIANWPVEEGDRLPQHCFRDYAGAYYDEMSNRLRAPVIYEERGAVNSSHDGLLELW